MKRNVATFLNDHFQNLTLAPPLFYSWAYGLRFEISMPWVEHENKENLKQIEERTNRIFHDVFDAEDDVFLVTDLHSEKDDRFLQKRPTKVYQKYMKSKDIRKRLQYTLLPCVFLDDEDYEVMVTHRFSLLCKTRDIRFQPLLTAISYEDFPHPSRILKGFPRNGIDIYFVNVTKKMIYHLYDDRGCDVIASNKEDLRSLYEQRNEWILDYDREQIDRIFK
ncbi:DUF3885 domain-containing protein [Bacillus sp. CGMCC 1.16541]|uniref:DUF3885 domain-containing protein n=1 Tax=Bacillus sp. CGMCC 1.16541 TaxID=2185143 RepID=UPI000D73BA7A|nr:DUF3885 domain-containing protein [Bacillus sp. CGMCC 1.16541]